MSFFKKAANLNPWSHFGVAVVSLGIGYMLSAMSMEAGQAAGDSNAMQLVKPSVADDRSRKETFLIENYGIRGPLSWDALHKQMRDDFTLNGAAELHHTLLFSNSPWSPGQIIDHNEAGNLQVVWSLPTLERFIDLARRRDPGCSVYGDRASTDFYAAFDAFPVKGKSVLIVGSLDPWVEAIAYVYEAASITTVDFNVPKVEMKEFEVVSIADLDSRERRFDAIVSYSSLEHDGLGRYGDPVNPNGDLERMKRLQLFLNPGGLVYLAVPNGKDALYFNAHRVYGHKRFPLLTEGFEELGVFAGYDPSTMYDINGYTQPIHVLKLKSKPGE